MLREEEIDNFPCVDLCTINQLWLHYSDGKFGFSVHKEIYESLGGTRDYNRDIWESFGNCVGWRKEGSWFVSWIKGGGWLGYDELTFKIVAPRGHLPRTFWKGDLRDREKVETFAYSISKLKFIPSIAHRLITCEI